MKAGWTLDFEKVWRWFGLLVIGSIVLFPALRLLSGGFTGDIGEAVSSLRQGSLFSSLARSGILLGAVVVLALTIGFPIGLFLGLRKIRLGSLFLGLLTAPLLMPPFLWALG